MHETGCSGLVHWDDPEGWDGEGSRRGFQDGEHVHPWLIHVNVWQKPLQYYKVISLQLKLKKFLKRNDLFLFPRQTIQYHSNPVCALISNAEKAEVEWFYEDLQDLLELTPRKDIPFITGDWNAKVGS